MLRPELPAWMRQSPVYQKGCVNYAGRSDQDWPSFHALPYCLPAPGIRSLADQNIRATWTLFPSGPDIINAMHAGRLDLGYIGLPPVIIGIDRGLKLACIAGGHIEGTAMIAGNKVRSLDECSNMEDFLSQMSGKTIGTPPKGSIHDVIVNDLLQRNKKTEISVKNYPWADFLPDALVSGEIVAAAGTPALATTARRYGSGRLVVSPDQLWPFNPSYGIVVMREMLKKSGLLTGFLIAHELPANGFATILKPVPGLWQKQRAW